MATLLSEYNDCEYILCENFNSRIGVESDFVEHDDIRPLDIEAISYNVLYDTPSPPK